MCSSHFMIKADWKNASSSWGRLPLWKGSGWMQCIFSRILSQSFQMMHFPQRTNHVVTLMGRVTKSQVVKMQTTKSQTPPPSQSWFSWNLWKMAIYRVFWRNVGKYYWLNIRVPKKSFFLICKSFRGQPYYYASFFLTFSPDLGMYLSYQLHHKMKFWKWPQTLLMGWPTLLAKRFCTGAFGISSHVRNLYA